MFGLERLLVEKGFVSAEEMARVQRGDKIFLRTCFLPFLRTASRSALAAALHVAQHRPTGHRDDDQARDRQHHDGCGADPVG